MSRHASIIALTVTLLSACSSGTRTAGVQAGTIQSHNMLSEAELQIAKDRTVYETVQRLRPSFFRSRQVATSSTPNPEPVHVYVNGTRAEGLDALRLFSPQAVKEIRFYEPAEANVKFGPGHWGGLLDVTLEQ